MLFRSGVIELAKSNPWITAEKAAFTIVLLGEYLLAALGVLVLRRDKHNVCLWLLLGASLYFVAVSAAVGKKGADARYRLPVMPVVSILAAAGFLRGRVRNMNDGQSLELTVAGPALRELGK